MKCFFRFEDTYGMYSLVFRILNGTVPSAASVDLSESFLAKRSYGITTVFNVTQGFADYCKSEGIECVIFVYDYDSMSGSQSEIMTLNQFKYGRDSYIGIGTGAERAVHILRDTGIKYIRFIPVVYCAESILLYPHYSGHPEMFAGLVGKSAPCKYASVLIAAYHAALCEFLKTHNPKKVISKVKELMNIVDISALLSCMPKDAGLNSRLCNWLKNGCILSNTAAELMDYDEAVQHLVATESLYHSIRAADPQLVFNNLNIRLNDCDAQELFECLQECIPSTKYTLRVPNDWHVHNLNVF